MHIILGASPNPDRYAYQATILLQSYNYKAFPVGIKDGKIGAANILSQLPEGEIDTITLYLNPFHQEKWLNEIIARKPKRIIFNPGSENIKLEMIAQDHGIITQRACTLVLLRTGQYDQY
ncbi:CoA-binding protein [Aureibacter tunicatorum]|uniref:CoA-binding domain-containing protein n=1 Tax=Aureibacter tunicatorum TaxID=866807 RepID=A0AAE3XRT9_9BACT|nr:CoA-binding protein [Aureibacter tunicatorum]MDR6240736.1 hypothetical protein [Aureibacter tunicatorum]BDD06931.1 CoA-binding protein [Aureibacter tunicatorum]